MTQNSDGKASSGQPFKPPKAETWNSMIDAGNAYRNSLLSSSTPDRTRPRQTDIIKVKNTSGAARARGQILRFSNKAVTDLSDEHIWLVGSAPTADGYFGVLKEPIENNAVGEIQVSGCCMAQVNVVSSGHTKAKVSGSGFVLESSDNGPIEILYKPSGTGELECVIRFASSSETDGSIVRSIEYVVVSSSTALTGPYTGLPIAMVRVYGVACGMDTGLIGQEVLVVDHSKQIFDEPNMVGLYGWADEKVFLSLDSNAEPGELTPCHWCATNRTCDDYDDDYAEIMPD